MPTYTFQCADCGQLSQARLTIQQYGTIRDTIPRCECNGKLKRSYEPFKFTMPFWDGYSPTTGTFTTSHRDLTEQMHIASEHATERTGIQHDFKPVDVRDTESLGVTEEGLDDTNRRLHNEGRPLIKHNNLDL